MWPSQNLPLTEYTPFLNNYYIMRLSQNLTHPSQNIPPPLLNNYNIMQRSQNLNPPSQNNPHVQFIAETPWHFVQLRYPRVG